MKLHLKRSQPSRKPKSVAVILAGAFRSMPYCMPLLETYFAGGYDVNFFLSTWDNNVLSPGTRSNTSNMFVSIDDLPDHITTQYLSELRYPLSSFNVAQQDVMSAKHQVIADEACQSISDAQKKYAYDNATDPANVVNTLNQFYLLAKGWDLVQDYERQAARKFDVIVRARPDIIFRRPFLYPFPGEIVTDSLRFARTRKHGLFDGYFAGWRDEMIPLLEGYNSYREQLSDQIFFKEYISEVTVKWPFFFTTSRRVAGDEGRQGVIHTEFFYRYLLAQQSKVSKIDSRVSAVLVRPIF